MFYILHFMFYILCLTFYTLHFTAYVLHLTFYILHFMFYSLQLLFCALHFTFTPTFFFCVLHNLPKFSPKSNKIPIIINAGHPGRTFLMLHPACHIIFLTCLLPAHQIFTTKKKTDVTGLLLVKYIDIYSW